MTAVMRSALPAARASAACAAQRRASPAAAVRACATSSPRASRPAPAARLRRCGRDRLGVAPRAAGTLLGAATEPDGAAEPAPPPLVPRTPQDKKRLIMAAIKPPIYTVALVPVLVRARAPRCAPRSAPRALAAADSGCAVSSARRAAPGGLRRCVLRRRRVRARRAGRLRAVRLPRHRLAEPVQRRMGAPSSRGSRHRRAARAPGRGAAAPASNTPR